MKHIICGTNRPESNSFLVSQLIQKLYARSGETVGLIDLKELELGQLGPEHLSGKKSLPPELQKAVASVTNSDGLIIVCPEYNGGMPGALKTFIDFWKFPDSFESRPVCYVGVSAGQWGAIHPIDHLVQIFGYRNAYQFPQKVYLKEIHKVLKNGALEDANLLKLLENQVAGFQKFCSALKAAGLDANSVPRQ
ncbi:MAG: NADPH-dependent FMN reductase [Bdellovibrionales bacterium]